MDAVLRFALRLSGAEDRAEKGARTAEDGHQDHFARRGPLHPLRPCEGVGAGQQAARQTSVHAGNHEGAERVGAGVDAGVVETVLVGLHRLQHHAERRLEDAHRDVEGGDQEGAAEIVANVELELVSEEGPFPGRVHRQPERYTEAGEQSSTLGMCHRIDIIVGEGLF